jgi:hypothetical protein
MEEDIKLSDYSNVIEGALCAYDIELENKLKDNDAIKIIELLIDKYHFSDEKIETDDKLIRLGFDCVDKAIIKDLSDIKKEILVKTLGIIRFVAKRRTKLGREYMGIIHQFVGQRLDTGLRVLPGF